VFQGGGNKNQGELATEGEEESQEKKGERGREGRKYIGIFGENREVKQNIQVGLSNGRYGKSMEK